MTSRTTVAIDKELRKKLKKLSAWLDITQAEVIKRALGTFEKELLKNKGGNTKENNFLNKTSAITVKKVLKDATKIVWKMDPERKAIQQKLSSGTDTIDNYILNNWESGLEE